jgi:hypothetical protein
MNDMRTCDDPMVALKIHRAALQVVERVSVTGETGDSEVGLLHSRGQQGA